MSWTLILRVPWRLLSFGVAWLLAQGIAESILGPLFASLSRAVGEPIPVYPWAMLIGVAAACQVALRFVDDVPWSVMALGDGAWHPRRLLLGLALGTAAIFLTALLLFLIGSLHFEPTPTASVGDGQQWQMVQDTWGGTALRLLMVLLPAALWEELVFRGYFHAVADEAGGVLLARWTSSVAFGLVHLLNPGATVQTTLIVTLAGLCLSVVREQTDSLPAAFTAHLAWNWMMAAVLHLPVSGLPFATPKYRAVLEGPSWLTGGAWGPEGGLVAALVLGGALLGAPSGAVRRNRVQGRLQDSSRS